MCGIAGVVDHGGDRVDADLLAAAATAIRHRGPDDCGVYTSDGVGLTAVRLAIIDLSPRGHQPMTSADGRYVLVYNGELYNYRELAAQLEAEGITFRSRSDTEVVLRAYEFWGAGCVERFNGMFAFAVWDTVDRRLFVARDRFGVKPLYWAEERGRVVFGSEIKALLALGVVARVSPAALSEYFTFQNVFSDVTLFDGVRLLPPGSTMTVEDGRTTIRRYWDYRFEPDEELDADAWVTLVRGAFERAVTRQLVADVPVGSYLSGGMDSASIATVAARSIPRLMTFTGGFDLSSVDGIELVFDERADAEAVASQIRTEHYEMVMHAGDMQWVMPELIWHLEDLRVGMSYQNHYIARLASKFVKVVLAGTGGDELFGGYPWRYELVASLDDPREFERVHYDYWTRLVRDDEKPAFFARRTWEAVSEHPALDAYRGVLSGSEHLDPLTKALYFEAKTFLPGLLIVEDKVSMAHSLESRVPFLDNDLADLAVRVPPQLKHSPTGSGKEILRRAMEGILPHEILRKPKQGFSPPDQAWYRGQSMRYLESILLDPRTLARGYFQAPYVERILHEHLQGRVNHRLLIWSLLAFEWWNRLFIDGDHPERHAGWHRVAEPIPRVD